MKIAPKTSVTNLLPPFLQTVASGKDYAVCEKNNDEKSVINKDSPSKKKWFPSIQSRLFRDSVIHTGKTFLQYKCNAPTKVFTHWVSFDIA